MRRYSIKINPKNFKLKHPDTFPAEYVEIMNKNFIKKRKIITKISNSNYQKNSLVKRFHRIYSEITSRKLTNLTNSDVINEQQYYNKLYINEYLSCFYALFSIAFSIAYDEMKNNFGAEQVFIKFPIFISIFSIFLWINIILGDIICLEYDKRRNIVSSDSTLITSGRWKTTLLKLIVFFFHPNPFTTNFSVTSYYLQIDKSVTRSLDSTLTVLCFLRIYFVFRFMLFSTKYMEPASDRLYKSYYFNANYVFSFKAVFKENSLQSYLVTITILACAFAYSIRIFEREIQPSLGLYLNSLWFMFITMVTIGYGDIVAKTDEGRFLSILMCIISIFMLSVLTISVSNLLKMSKNEENCVKILDSIKRNNERENYSKKILANLLKILIRNKEESLNNIVNEQRESFQPLKKAIREFNSYENKFIGEVHSKPDTYVLNSLILCVNKEFESLEEKQNLLISETEIIKNKLKDIKEHIEEEEDRISEVNNIHKESIFERTYMINNHENDRQLLRINTELPKFVNDEDHNNHMICTEQVNKSISVISDKTESQDLNFNVKKIVKLLNKNK